MGSKQRGKNTRTILLFSLLALFLFVLSLSSGSTFISPIDVLYHLLGLGNGEYDFTINTLRLPRVLLAFLVGAALGVAGLILQGVVRNPLAAPDIIGITSGASVGAILFVVYLMGSVSFQWLPFAALFTAGISTLIIYLLAWNKGVSPMRLILIGIGMAAGMKAVVTMLIVLSDTVVTSKAYLWLTGSLYGANWQDVSLMTPWVVVFIPLALLFSRTLNVMELGDQAAMGLGVRVQLSRFLLLAISVALAGSAVAFAGGIEFVGLIAPHISRMLIGRSNRGLIVLTSLVGASMVMLADLIARTAFLPLDIPAGVFTAGIGAPYFIYLLYKNRNLA